MMNRALCLFAANFTSCLLGEHHRISKALRRGRWRAGPNYWRNSCSQRLLPILCKSELKSFVQYSYRSDLLTENYIPGVAKNGHSQQPSFHVWCYGHQQQNYFNSGSLRRWVLSQFHPYKSSIHLLIVFSSEEGRTLTCSSSSVPGIYHP